MTKAQTQLLNSVSPEFQKVIIKMAEDLKPALQDIHNSPQTSQNYYIDYMRLLSYKPKYKKIMAIALLYAGANPSGIEAAIKFV